MIDYVAKCSSIMKGKASKKPRKTRSKKVLTNVASSAPSSPATERPVDDPPTTVVTLFMPPADFLLQQAEQEPDMRGLSVYVDSIRVLREKGFSYREIADWFSEHGVDVDHNTVYRVFMNSLSDLEAHLEAERDEEES